MVDELLNRNWHLRMTHNGRISMASVTTKNGGASGCGVHGHLK
jgi:hypothetical protein